MGDDLPNFMERNLARSDYVLMICTEAYVDKANEGNGRRWLRENDRHCGSNKNIDSNKIIPIILKTGPRILPTFLITKLGIDMSLSGQAEFGFDELVRTIQGAPLYEKPKIGTNPYIVDNRSVPRRSSDDRPELMKIIVTADNKAIREYINYRLLVNESCIYRIMLDFLIDQAKEEELITQSPDHDIYLTKKGRFYAIENKLT